MTHPRHCERSEAIHRATRKVSVDCFVASLLAMTEMEAAGDRYFRLGDIDIAIILMRDGESLDLPR